MQYPDVTQALEILNHNIAFDLKHPNYERTVEIAQFCQRMMSGEGQREYIIKYREKETEAQKEARVRLTNSLTPFVLNPVRRMFQKVHRIEPQKEEISHTLPEQAARIKGALSRFYAGKDVNAYLKNRLLHFNFADPNAWIIIERKDYRGEENAILKTEVYPLEVSSAQALNFGTHNGLTDWLIVGRNRTERGQRTYELQDLYFYTAGLTIEYLEYMEVIPEETPGRFFVEIDIQATNKKRYFAGRIFSTGSTEFPGAKAGIYSDPESTDAFTFVPPYYAAKPILMDLIRDKSFLDLNKVKHVFLQKYAVAPDCGFEGHYKDVYVECKSGFLNGNTESPCPSCKGTGKDIHFSEQDVMILSWPESKEQTLDLSSLTNYVQLPEWLPKFLVEEVETNRKRVQLAIFNTVNEEQPIAAKTATEVSLNWDEVNNVVHEYAELDCDLFELAGRVTAQYLEVKPDGLTVTKIYPGDLKLQPLTALIATYKSKKDAGLGYDTLWQSNLAILNKELKNTPGMVEEVEAWEWHRPFRSKSDEIILGILMERDTTDRDRLLWENWDTVQTIVWEKMSGKPFAKVDFAGQKKLIDEALEVVKMGIKTRVFEAPALPFMEPVTDDEDDLEGEEEEIEKEMVA